MVYFLTERVLGLVGGWVGGWGGALEMILHKPEDLGCGFV